jgi:hypothetical protein
LRRRYLSREGSKHAPRSRNYKCKLRGRETQVRQPAPRPANDSPVRTYVSLSSGLVVVVADDWRQLASSASRLPIRAALPCRPELDSSFIRVYVVIAMRLTKRPGFACKYSV